MRFYFNNPRLTLFNEEAKFSEMVEFQNITKKSSIYWKCEMNQIVGLKNVTSLD